MRRLLNLTLLLWILANVAVGEVGTATSTVVQMPRWRTGPIRVSISQSLLQVSPNIKYDSDVRAAIRRSFEAWQAVADVEFIEDVSDRQSVSPPGAFGDSVSLITIAPTSENALLFKNENEAAAKTRVFVNRRGQIAEADIVLSPFQQFSTDGTFGTFDLETTITHEIGHLLGLHHSMVVGSMMYAVIPKNGTFGEAGLTGGRIGADDISAVRDLYGAGSEEGCCGAVAGRISGSAKSGHDVFVWLRDAKSGRIAGHATTSKDGGFRIGGVHPGAYDVYAREISRTNRVVPAKLGSLTVIDSETTVFSHRFDRQLIDFSVDLLGKNGILSDSGVRLRRGGTYVLFLGGRNFASDRFQIEAGSPFLAVDQSSVADSMYDGGLSGMRFSLSVDTETPKGNYDVCVISRTGERDCIIGGISIVGD